MSPENLFVARKRRLEHLHPVEESGRAQALVDHADPIGAFRVMRAHLMAQAVVMGQV
jgi:hypothetical protein